VDGRRLQGAAQGVPPRRVPVGARRMEACGPQGGVEDRRLEVPSGGGRWCSDADAPEASDKGKKVPRRKLLQARTVPLEEEPMGVDGRRLQGAAQGVPPRRVPVGARRMEACGPQGGVEDRRLEVPRPEGEKAETA
jgi:hypothetical protein